MTARTVNPIILLAVLVGSAAVATANPFMGEYAGTFFPDSKVQMRASAVVVAEADNDRFRIVIKAVSTDAGRDGAQVELYAHSSDGLEATISDRAGGYHWNGRIRDGHLSVGSAYGLHFELDKIVRKSPTEGELPPAGAVILLPFKKGAKADISAWTNAEWKTLDNGVMQVNKGATRTKEQFGDIQRLHLEFKLPLEPNNRGQGRCNSGLFLNDSYEVQILDSFGLVHTSGDCGGIYNVKRADVNACLPPQTWQTYDIEFRTPRLNDDGSVKEGPRLTVRLNGITIHNDLEIPHPTADPNAKVRTRGPLQLQDHGHPIEFRNIWLVKG